MSQLGCGSGGTARPTDAPATTRHKESVCIACPLYELGSLPVGTVGILDGFSASQGDSAGISFAVPLDPTVPVIFVEVRLGVSLSIGGEQRSKVSVDGTENAGNFDNGVGGRGDLAGAGLAGAAGAGPGRPRSRAVADIIDAQAGRRLPTAGQESGPPSSGRAGLAFVRSCRVFLQTGVPGVGSPASGARKYLIRR